MKVLPKDLYDYLKAKGLLEYGASIPKGLIHKLCGIEVPEIGTRSDFSRVDVEELHVMGPVRDTLLNEGKYLKTEAQSFIILLPSENAAQIERYCKHAKAKLNRAEKLSKSSPPGYFDRDTMVASIKARQRSEKRRRESMVLCGSPGESRSNVRVS
jgi:hypothetical protein